MTPDEIRALRQRLGLTLAEMARQLNVDTSTVHRWEKGQRSPRDYMVKGRLEQLARESEKDQQS